MFSKTNIKKTIMIDTDFQNNVNIHETVIKEIEEPKIDRPLSPVLSGSNRSRKFFQKKKVKRQLLDNEIFDKATAVTEFNDNDLGRLEEIEENRQQWYNIFMKNKKHNLFKEPEPLRFNKNHNEKQKKSDDAAYNCVNMAIEELISDGVAGNEPTNTTDNGITEEKCNSVPSTSCYRSVKEIKTSNGFTSASGKEITVSSESLTKATAIFNETLDDLKLSENNVSLLEIDDLNIRTEVKILEDAIQKDIDINPFKTLKVSSTLTGSKIALSDQTVKDGVAVNSRNYLGCSSFTTASNKPVYLSEKSLVKVKRMFDNDLQTSSNSIKKKIAYLKEVLEDNQNASIQQCEVAECVNHENEDISISFTQEISKSGISDADMMMIASKCLDNIEQEIYGNDEIDKANILHRNSVSNISGFSSASGKEIKISSTSLAKASVIFHDNPEKENVIVLNKKDNLEGSSRSTIKNNIKLLDEAIQKEVQDFTLNNIQYKNSLGCSSFTTASSKPVYITDKSLQKVKRLFYNLDDDLEINCELVKDKTEPQEPMVDCLLPKSRVLPTPFNSLTKEKYTENADSVQEIITKKVSKEKFRLLDDLIKRTEVHMGMTPSNVEDDFRKGKLNRENVNRKLVENNYSRIDIKSDTLKRENVVVRRPKRKLGISFCRQINIPESKLKKAKVMFEQELQIASPMERSKVDARPTEDIQDGVEELNSGDMLEETLRKKGQADMD